MGTASWDREGGIEMPGLGGRRLCPSTGQRGVDHSSTEASCSVDVVMRRCRFDLPHSTVSEKLRMLLSVD